MTSASGPAQRRRARTSRPLGHHRDLLGLGDLVHAVHGGVDLGASAAQAAGDKFASTPVCSGPFKFVERVAQDRIVFERYANYWNKAAINFEKVIYTPIPDATEIAGPVDGAWFSYAGVYEDGAYTTRDESRLVDGKTFSRYVLDEREGVAGDEPEYAQKWTESQTPVDPATAGMGAMVKSLLSSLPAADGLQGQDVEADGLRRSGHDAVRYTLAAPVAGAEDSSVAMTAFTVARSTGELLTVETQSGGVPAVITFSEWNAVPPVEAPAAEDIAPQQAQPQGLGG